MKVCIYRCFEADQRLSMQVYADSLVEGMQTSDFDVDCFTPSSSLDRFSHNLSVMRFLRYVQYPLTIKSVKADIHHVIDHGYAHLLPRISSGKTCITVHDLIPLLSWNGVIKVNSGINQKSVEFRKPYLNLYSLKFLANFDGVITPSQSSREDLVTFLNLDPNKISVIPPIIGACFKHVGQNQIEEFRKQHNLCDSSKWIMISGGGYYKNHETCLQVLQKLNLNSEVPVKMIRTGIRSLEFDNQVQRLGLNEYVKNLYLEKASDLAVVYAAVNCLLFPSLYEGFGMPVAEALACGTPVVTSTSGSLNEVSGDLASQHDAYDVSGLSEAVYKSLFDPSVKQKVMHGGGAWVEQFRQKNIVQKVERVYSALLI